MHALGMDTVAGKGEQAFISAGFSNWKDANQDFKRHANSKSYTPSQS